MQVVHLDGTCTSGLMPHKNVFQKKWLIIVLHFSKIPRVQSRAG